MNAEAFTYGQLSNPNNGITALMERIYPAVPTQDVTLPYLVYIRENTETICMLGGERICRTRVRLDFWNFSDPLLMQTRDAIIAALHGTNNPSEGIIGCVQVDNSQEVELEGLHDSLTFLITEEY